MFAIDLKTSHWSSMVLGGATIYYTQQTATGSIFSVPVADDAGSTPLALQQLFPTAIDIDQQYIYWTNIGQSGQGQGAVVRCKTGNCSATVTPLQTSLDGPIGVKSDGTYVYYSVHGSNDGPNNGIWRMVNP